MKISFLPQIINNLPLIINNYLALCFGSRYSRKPSPIKLKAKTVKAIAIPGKNNTCGAFIKVSSPRASSIIVPQLGAGGGIPNPKNDKEASDKTAPAIPSDA